MESISMECEVSIYNLSGKWNDYIGVQKEVKKQKVATLRILPMLIREGKLLADEVQNYYSEEGERFAYFICKIFIDNEIHDIRIAVKKKINSNHFYIHHIDTKKVLNYSAHLKKTDNYEIQNS